MKRMHSFRNTIFEQDLGYLLTILFSMFTGSRRRRHPKNTGSKLPKKVQSDNVENFIDLGVADILSRDVAVKNDSSSETVPKKHLGKIFPSNESISNIFIVSATARAGSSFFGEIMSATPETFYFYEPRHLMSHFTDRETFVNIIRDLFACDFSSLNFNVTKNLYSILRHSSTDNCRFGKTRCEKPLREHLEKLCLSSSRRVLKTIIIPLFWIKEMVEDTKENAKFIHLIRDPRPALMSAKKVKFPADKVLNCERMNEVRYFT